MANITPTTNIIEAMRKQSLRWNYVLGELIDNAFDAGANRILISFDGRQLEVIDDGVGCKNLLLLVQPGARESKQTTVLGRYGIGAKDAAISVADSISVTSVHKGIKRYICCNWKHLEAIGSWEIDDPQESPTAESSGTRIILQPLRSDRIKRPGDLLEKLSLYYTPAIRQGKQIIFRSTKNAAPQPIPEYRFPPLERQMTVNLDVDGKLARATIGLIPEGQSSGDSGLIISYGFRIIVKDGRSILGDQPIPGLFGWVELGEGWELTKNKDKISSNLDALGHAIYVACKEVIDLATKRSQTIQFRNVSQDINKVLRELHHGGTRQRKAKRSSKSNETGAIIPVHTPKRHTQARVSQPGSTFQETIGGSRALSVSFEHKGKDGPAFSCNGNVVYLNVDIPAVNVDQRDERALSRHAIYVISLWLALNNNELPFMRHCETDIEKVASVAGHLMTRLSQQNISLAEAT